MSRATPPPLKRPRSRGQLALLLNAGLCPGLGSWVAGHRAQGALQMLLAAAGVALVGVWFLTLARALARIMEQEPDMTDRIEFAIAGLAFFAASWLWGLLTALQVQRRERAEGARS
jgi:hypothetical protein